jgi:hypothetical protein
MLSLATSDSSEQGEGGVWMAESYPYELRLPLAPYRFMWANEEAVDCQKSYTEAFSEERYTHADGCVVIVRHYSADGSFHIMSDRGAIQLVDNAGDYRSPVSISVVKLP